MRLLALGDSYTVGEGIGPQDSWPRLLEQRRPVLDATVIARTGWTSGELLAALTEQPPAPWYDIATVMVGVNDQYRGLGFDELEANASAVVDIAQGVARRVVVISIPDWSVTPHGADFDRELVAREIDAFNAGLRQMAIRYRLPFVDITAIGREQPEMVAPDGLHPSAAQHELWAAEIEQFLGAES